MNHVKQMRNSKFKKKKPQYHFKIQLPGNPAMGINLEAAPPGGQVKISIKQFVTDYDSEFFFTILDEFTSLYLGKWMLDTGNVETSINNCLILINKNNLAEIFINIPITMEFISKRKILKNSLVTKDDIADIRKVTLEGFDIPANCGLIYLFSIKWRRGLYFDFSALHPGYNEESPNLSSLFAAFHAYLIFPEVLRLDDELKSKLFNIGWFPFIRILGNNFKSLFNTIKFNLPIENTENEILASFDENRIKEMFNAWMEKKLFSDRGAFIQNGVDSYISGNYINAIHVLYPQIEGILQYLEIDSRIENNLTEKLITKLSTNASKNHPESLLFLIDDFSNYLKSSYFKRFVIENGEHDLSRHSLAHGAAINESDFTQINAFRAILILDQLSFYIK